MNFILPTNILRIDNHIIEYDNQKLSFGFIAIFFILLFIITY